MEIALTSISLPSIEPERTSRNFTYLVAAYLSLGRGRKIRTRAAVHCFWRPRRGTPTWSAFCCRKRPILRRIAVRRAASRRMPRARPPCGWPATTAMSTWHACCSCRAQVRCVNVYCIYVVYVCVYVYIYIDMQGTGAQSTLQVVYMYVYVCMCKHTSYIIYRYYVCVYMGMNIFVCACT